MVDVLVAEWVKVRSVRSTYVVLGAVAGVVLLGAFLTWNGMQSWDHLTAQQRANVQIPPPAEQVMLPVVQLCLGTLGVLAITSEYATGMIRTSLTAVPRRRVVLGAKAFVVGIVALAAGQAFMFATFAATRAIVGHRPIPGHTAPLHHEAPLLASLGLSVTVVALLGLGLGTVTRSTVAAIVAVAGLLFVVPGLAQALPGPLGTWAGTVMLPNLPKELAGTDHTLAPPVALLALAAYVVAALVAAATVLRRRDV
jgi:ABC-2 type transport system permease protein